MAESPQLGEGDVARFVAQRGLDAELVFPGRPTPTVRDAAAALGVEPAAILKSLVFLAGRDEGESPVLVIAAGEARIAYPKLAGVLELSRRRVRLASAEETLALSGYAAGGVPPFAHRSPLPTLVDNVSVPAEGTVYGGGGSDRALIRLDVATLFEVTAARAVPLT